VKLQDAKAMCFTDTGFYVSWERRQNGMLHSDHTPDWYNGEPMFATEGEAWELADYLAANAPRDIVNIHVVCRHLWRGTQDNCFPIPPLARNDRLRPH